MITPSFLENFVIRDKNDKKIGFVEKDGVYFLDGEKARCGSNEAQQIVTLTDETRRIVEQIITITKPLRSYLKSVNDDNYRYLLLSSGKGFSKPIRIKALCSYSKTNMPLEIAEATGMTLDEASAIVDRYSLSSLRASAGVLVYIKTKSVAEMAKALGHKEYSPRLLSHYLPRPIQKFFQDRWIRIFQTGIIVEALKDSEYLLEASGFQNMDELHDFLENHALKIMPKHLCEPAINKTNKEETYEKKDEVVFGVNAEILTMLLGLQQAVSKAEKPVNGKARYWAGIATHLTEYIESSLLHQEDIQEHLSRAKESANPEEMERLIYA